jgi:hypothetical protein
MAKAPISSPSVKTAPATFRFDREELLALAAERSEDYASARPFPHAVFDDFLPEQVLDDVLAEFPRPDEDWFAFESPLERKLASKDDSIMGPSTRGLLWALNSPAFVEFLERLTGIDALVPDPHFDGGGLHQIERGGHLKVHADFNRHPRTHLERRLNVLLYLNRGWKDEYGGALELWGRDMSRCEQRILPYFNRCVVFSTTSTSYHGHPDPLTCPEGETRKSIALYYYSKDRPPLEESGAHNTLFRARPGEELQEPEPAPEPAPVPPRERLEAAVIRVTPPILLDAVVRRRKRRG